MDPKKPDVSPSPAEEADQIGGDANPYPVGDFKHAREDSERKAEEVKQAVERSPGPQELDEGD